MQDWLHIQITIPMYSSRSCSAKPSRQWNISTILNLNTCFISPNDEVYPFRLLSLQILYAQILQVRSSGLAPWGSFSTPQQKTSRIFKQAQVRTTWGMKIYAQCSQWQIPSDLLRRFYSRLRSDCIRCPSCWAGKLLRRALSKTSEALQWNLSSILNSNICFISPTGIMKYIYMRHKLRNMKSKPSYKSCSKIKKALEFCSCSAGRNHSTY